MKNFKGFQSPNFTQIPNEYLDYTFSPECNLSKVQMQIMNFVFRETFGWQDKHKILVFSATNIMDLLNIKKRKTITDALAGLVDDKQFLESIEVTKLTKKVRSNIEKSLGRKLQPRQKIYRLNLIEGRKRTWDNVEEPHTNIYERKEQFKSSNQTVTSDQTVTTGSNQMVTTSSNQTVTTLDPESFEAVSIESSLNKGLNKGLNKKEEEEEVPFIQLENSVKEYLANELKYDIAILENIAVYMTEQGITSFTREEMSNQHNYMVEKNEAERIGDWAVYFVNGIVLKRKNPKNKVAATDKKKKRIGSAKQAIRTEMVPDWLHTDKEKQSAKEQKKVAITDEYKKKVWEQVRTLDKTNIPIRNID